MPNKDKTGPMGQGSKTGRRMGSCCSEYDWNNCCGMTRGGRNPNREEKKEILEKKANFLREQLEVIEKELTDLK